MNKLHIGKIIKKELKRQGRSIVWFSNAINKSESDCYYIFKKDTIEIGLLKIICQVLNYDFFKVLSDDFNGK